MRDIAFIDLETSGLDPARHEILEIGVIRVQGVGFAEIDRTDVRVHPRHIETADPAALAINGYSAKAWEDAASLAEALEWIAPLLDGVVLAGHNVAFDKAFLDAAWRDTGVTRPEMDHHVLDTATFAWPLAAAGLVDSLSLAPVCAALGIDDRDPHRALADADRSLDVARILLPEVHLLTRIRALEADERLLVDTIVERIDASRPGYGPWRVDDGRNYPHEALLEALDGMAYLAAELVRIGRHRQRPSVRTRRVYVCHPFAGDPEGNAARVRAICGSLADAGLLPIAPHVYLPQFIDEATERERAMALCLELAGDCDEVRVYGGRVTEGMRREIEHAEARGIPVRFAEEVA